MRRKLIIPIPIIIVIAVILLGGVGIVGALNGWFGGGGSIPEDTFTRGLVGYWAFEEGSGTTAYDASSYANDGTFGTYMATSTDAWTTGKVGGALQFDGTDDYVDCGNRASLNFGTGDFSLELWVKTTDTAGFILHKGQVGTKAYYITFTSDSSGKIEAKIIDDVPVAKTITSASAINDGSWRHIVVVFDRSANGQIYIDGSADGNPVDITAVGDTDNATYGLHLGRQRTATANYFSGLIDEVRIYNRALSAEEVRYHYNRGGPVAHWKMDEGSGSTVYDSTDNNHDGTLYGEMATSTVPESGWTTGKHGSALAFDGIDDYVRTSQSITGDTELTGCVWYYANGAPDAKDGLLNGHGYDFHMWINSDGTFDYGAWTDNTNEEFTSATSYSFNAWRFICVVVKSQSYAKLYVDGQLDDQTSIVGNLRYPIDFFDIGRHVNYDGNYFNGLIDEVRIYNYARSMDEIRLDYNAGFGAKFGYSAGTCEKDPGACMTQGLVGYWNFEEGSGTTVHDTSDYSNNGTLGGGTSAYKPDWDSGVVPLSGGKSGGGALHFDGTDDYVEAGDTSAFKFLHGAENPTGFKWTIGFWVNLDDPNPDGNQEFIATRAQLNGAAGVGISIIFDDRSASGYTRRLLMFIYNGRAANATLSLDEAYPDDSNMHFLVFTYDHSLASENAKIYVDSILKTSGNKSAATPTTTDSGYPLNIGRSPHPLNYVDGTIDEVRVYSRALSIEEIRYHYNRGGPVAHWKMDEGSGTIAYDSTENNNDGTLYYMSTSTQGGWTEGKHGTALSFDGADDYVEVPDDNSLDVDMITVEGWVKSSGSANNQVMFYKSGGWATDGFYLIWWTSTNKLGGAVMTSDGSYDIGIIDESFSLNMWYHYVFTYDGSSARQYINGELKKTTAVTGTISSNTKPFLIGQNGGVTAQGEFFHGLIDDVRIYNYARSPDEIRLDYNAGFAARFGSMSTCDKDPGACMTEGLVGYWDMEEGSGTTAADLSDSFNDGTLGGDGAGADLPSWDSGIAPLSGGATGGGGLQFDGTDDFVDVGSPASLAIANPTIEAWIKPSSVSGYYLIYGLTNLPKLYIDPNGKLVLYDASAANTALTPNVWTHVVAVSDGSNVYYYVNGVPDGTVAYGAWSTTPSQVKIGQDPASSSQNFPGLIDEVRIYNRALSAEEIRYHYNRGGPVAHWKMEEGSGTTVYDSTANDNDGTIYWATSSPWVSGKHGTALSFDGADDYVDCGNGESLQIGGNSYTIAAWVKYISGGQLPVIMIERTDGGGYIYFDSIYGNIRLMTYTGGATIGLTSPLDYNDNKWHHVVGMRDKSANLASLYIDGILVKTGGIGDDISYPIGINCYISYAAFGAAKVYFNGLIDEVRIYNYARTPAEIRLDYNAGFSTYFK